MSVPSYPSPNPDADPGAVAGHGAVPSARELRRQVRDWRRGRATLTLGEVISDAYVVLFTAVVLVAMLVSVLLDLSAQADGVCAAECAAVRELSPWLTVLVLAVLALGVARLFGPVSSPPAANAWLLSAPVDRRQLLAPAWRRALTVAVLGVAAPLAVVALLAGAGWASGALVLVAGVGAALVCVGLAGLSQQRGDRVARTLTWLLVAVLWALLAAAAAGRFPAVAAPSQQVAGTLALVLVTAGVLAGLAVRRRLAQVSRRTLGATAGLPAALSGTLASLDLGLMFDVLLARRWSGSAGVRTRRGGPRGWWALLHRDLLRAARTPQPFVVLAGMLLVVHAVAAADVGRVVVLVTTFCALLVGPTLCVGLRVVTRTRSLMTMLPMSGTAVRSAHAVIPGFAFAVFGVAAGTALPSGLPVAEWWLLALGCGLSALAASMRWICAAPPDYASPLLATPGGAIPPGVMGSLFRGVDVWVLTAVPLLVPVWGPYVSLALSGVVIWYLLDKD